jgi:hypothetical protein
MSSVLTNRTVSPSSQIFRRSDVLQLSQQLIPTLLQGPSSLLGCGSLSICRVDDGVPSLGSLRRHLLAIHAGLAKSVLRLASGAGGQSVSLSFGFADNREHFSIGLIMQLRRFLDCLVEKLTAACPGVTTHCFGVSSGILASGFRLGHRFAAPPGCIDAGPFAH